MLGADKDYDHRDFVECVRRMSAAVAIVGVDGAQRDAPLVHLVRAVSSE